MSTKAGTALVPANPNTDITTLDVKLTTDDVVNIRVVQIEKQLTAELETLEKEQDELQKTRYENLGEKARKAEFADAIAAIKKIKGVILSEVDDDAEEGDNNMSFCNIGKKKIRATISFTVDRPVSAAIIAAEKEDKKKVDDCRKNYEKITAVKQKLSNMRKTEREVKANLAEWKLKQLGRQDILKQISQSS